MNWVTFGSIVLQVVISFVILFVMVWLVSALYMAYFSNRKRDLADAWETGCRDEAERWSLAAIEYPISLPQRVPNPYASKDGS